MNSEFFSSLKNGSSKIVKIKKRYLKYDNLGTSADTALNRVQTTC